MSKSLTALALMTAATPVIAAGPISDPAIRDPLVVARAADLARRACPAYRANMITAFAEARALKRQAVRSGMSESEIDEALSDGPAKRDVYARADALLASLPGDACARADALVARYPLARRLIGK